MTVVPAVVYLVTLVVRYEHSHGLGCGASCVRAGNGNDVNAPGAVPVPLGTELDIAPGLMEAAPAAVPVGARPNGNKGRRAQLSSRACSRPLLRLHLWSRLRSHPEGAARATGVQHGRIA